MPDLPNKKVGLVSCSGEELAEGTIARVATRLVLEELRPDDTVTICLPLFLAGGQEERAFARFYPTIAIDGCDKLCAKRGTEAHSGPVADLVVVSDILAELEMSPPHSRRALDEEGLRLARLVAEEIAHKVDVLRGEAKAPELGVVDLSGAEKPAAKVAPGETVCACRAGGLPVTQVEMAWGRVGIVGLQPLFERAYAQGLRPSPGVGEQLLQTVKVYNYVPASAEGEYAAALAREYATFCQRKGT
jgi:uncharacterized metal-binding protein